MKKKVSALEASLRAPELSADPEAPLPYPPINVTPFAEQAKPASSLPPSRAGKVAKTHYLPRAYWETLEEVSFRTRDAQGKRVTQERLVAEALNLLFHHYNFPQVREDDTK